MPRKTNWDIIKSQKAGQTIKNRDVYNDQSLARGDVGKPETMTSRLIMTWLAAIGTFLLIYMGSSFLEYVGNSFQTMLNIQNPQTEQEFTAPEQKYLKDKETDASNVINAHIWHGKLRGKKVYVVGTNSGNKALTYPVKRLSQLPIRGDWRVTNSRKYGFIAIGKDSDSTVATVGQIKSGKAMAVKKKQLQEAKNNKPSVWGYLFRFSPYKLLIALAAAFGVFELVYQLAKRNLANQNALKTSTDINQYHNDQHIMLPEEVMTKFEPFPDAGAHSWIQPSSLISHVALETKGLKKVPITRRYKADTFDSKTKEPIAYKGAPMIDAHGNRVMDNKPIIDKKFMDKLFTASGDPKDKNIRKYYDPTKIPFKPQLVGDVAHWKKAGVKTVADLINKDWDIPAYETQRPAGAYYVDCSPVNTMVKKCTVYIVIYKFLWVYCFESLKLS